MPNISLKFKRTASLQKTVSEANWFVHSWARLITLQYQKRAENGGFAVCQGRVTAVGFTSKNEGQAAEEPTAESRPLLAHVGTGTGAVLFA